MEQDNKIDVRKAFEAIAYILGKRHNVNITVVDVKKKDTKENPPDGGAIGQAG